MAPLRPFDAAQDMLCERHSDFLIADLPATCSSRRQRSGIREFFIERDDFRIAWQFSDRLLYFFTGERRRLTREIAIKVSRVLVT